MTKLFNSVFTDSEMRIAVYPFVATKEFESSSKSTHLSVLTFTYGKWISVEIPLRTDTLAAQISSGSSRNS